MTDTRRTDRVPLQCEIEFRRHGDARFRVDLLDLSPAGCCISPPVKVTPGEPIFLRIPGMEAVHATVAWVEEWRVGVEFGHAMHPAVFANLVKRLQG